MIKINPETKSLQSATSMSISTSGKLTVSHQDLNTEPIAFWACALPLNYRTRQEPSKTTIPALKITCLITVQEISPVTVNVCCKTTTNTIRCRTYLTPGIHYIHHVRLETERVLLFVDLYFTLFLHTADLTHRVLQAHAQQMHTHADKERK